MVEGTYTYQARYSNNMIIVKLIGNAGNRKGGKRGHECTLLVNRYCCGDNMEGRMAFILKSKHLVLAS